MTIYDPYAEPQNDQLSPIELANIEHMALGPFFVSHYFMYSLSQCTKTIDDRDAGILPSFVDYYPFPILINDQTNDIRQVSRTCAENTFTSS